MNTQFTDDNNDHIANSKNEDSIPATLQDHHRQGQGSYSGNLDNVIDKVKGGTTDGAHSDINHQHEKTPLKNCRTVSFSNNICEPKQIPNVEKEANFKDEKNVKPAVTVEDDDSRVPYDRGWAWMIVISCFVLFFVYVSHDNWHSVLLIDYLQEFNITVSLVTIMLSLGTVCYCVATQVSTNILVTKYSIRIVTTCAATLNVVATLIFAAAPNIGTFFVVNFIKFTMKGITLIATLILVGFYFRKRRGLATTLGLLGVSSSFICAPPLIRFLREEYGFRGCFLILAGLEMHGIIAALLLRPISSYKRKRVVIDTPKSDSDEKKSLTGNTLEKLTEVLENVELVNQSDISPSSIAETSPDDTDEITSDPSDVTKHLLEYDEANTVNDKIYSSNNLYEDMKTKIKYGVTSEEVTTDTYVNEKLKPDINIRSEQYGTEASDNNNVILQEILENNSKEYKYRGDTVSVESAADKDGSKITSKNMELNSQAISTNREMAITGSSVIVAKSLADRHQVEISSPKLWQTSNMSLVATSPMGSMLNITHVIEPQLSTESTYTEEENHYCSRVKDLIDISLLKNYLAIMVATMYIMINAGSFSIVYLPSYAKRVGLSSQNAAILLTIVGSMDMVGRLTFGFLTDLKWLRPHLIIAATSVVIGTVTHFMVLYNSLEKLIFFAVMQGLLGGAGQNLTTVLIVDVLGIQYLAKLLSMCSMFNSFSFIIQHPIQGAIIETTGNFVATFHYVGTSFLLAAVLLLCEPFIRRLQMAKEKKRTLQKLSEAD